MENLFFKKLVTESEILAGFVVMRHLRTNLDKASYLHLVTEARNKEGYQLVALYHHNKMVAITGFIPMITLYNGHFIWVCDLVTLPAERSKGYGVKLLEYVH